MCRGPVACYVLYPMFGRACKQPENEIILAALVPAVTTVARLDCAGAASQPPFYGGGAGGASSFHRHSSWCPPSGSFPGRTWPCSSSFSGLHGLPKFDHLLVVPSGCSASRSPFASQARATVVVGCRSDSESGLSESSDRPPPVTVTMTRNVAPGPLSRDTPGRLSSSHDPSHDACRQQPQLLLLLTA